MNRKSAESFWKKKSFETYNANMVATYHLIEMRQTESSPDYCVSTYVHGDKIAEYWPEYRSGLRYRSDLSVYGEAFLAESQ
jgi:hypothetical protein